MTLTQDTIITALLIYAGIIAILVWASLILWTYRDTKARSRDTLMQTGAAILVAIFTIPGFIAYLFLRPKETLAEAYERSLEEEALLQEIEEKPSCPGCGQTIQNNWRVCPYCHTTLKQSCIACKNLLELSWKICPYCTTVQPTHSHTNDVETYSEPQQFSIRQTRSNSGVSKQTELEFIDTDDY